MSDNALYVLKEEKIFLPANKWWNEDRAIADIKDNNQQYLIESLVERFKEVSDDVQKLKAEFDSNEDKLKVAGKIARTRSYLSTCKAIGDYSSLFQALDSMEDSIKKVVDEVLGKKEQLVKDAEALLEAKEWKESTDKLRELQKAFKDLPMVPDLKNEEFKDRFEKAKDEFFKRKQASYESFEQDLLDNLSKKIELCEKAEAMQNSNDWKKTTEEIQALNEAWKAIGMVPKHRNEELWFRFNTAKDIFFARKRENFEEIKTEQEANLTKKLEIIAKAEAIKNSTDWKKTSDEFNALMEEWKKTGRVSAEKNDEVWNQFLEIKNFFYKNKDAHYADIRSKLDDNYAKKMAIVKHAEELQNSNDFENATQEYQDMFEEWKTIGRIPKEHGDEPWERFMKAKRTFFDRKDAHREERKKELTKDIQERLSRNRSYYNKVSRELQREEELLFDVEDRLKNLPATLRSYEKREQYLEMVEEIKEKINFLKDKVNDVKDKIRQDEREVNYILRGPKKKQEEPSNKEPNNNQEAEQEHAANSKEVIETESPTATGEEVVGENPTE